MMYPSINLISVAHDLSYNGLTQSELNEQQIANLRILRDWLAENVVEFDIKTWRSMPVSVHYIKQQIAAKQTNVCGTSACALGWAPFAFPDMELPICDSSRDGMSEVAYHTFGEQLFGACWSTYEGLFAHDWGRHDRFMPIIDNLGLDLLRRESMSDIDRIFFIFRASLIIEHNLILTRFDRYTKFAEMAAQFIYLYLQENNKEESK